jgi:diadenosine tetraphosphate (Ap4A) HIT family hydrolase
MAEDCRSCEVSAGSLQAPGGFIFENELLTLTHHIQPDHATAGFLILQPRRHVEQIAELTLEEAAELGPMLRAASQALTHVLAPQKVYVCSFGSIVKHVHFYLIPQSVDMPNAARLLDELDTGRWACSDDEAADVAARIRVELAKNAYL